MLDWHRLVQRANDDGEFRLHARFWSAKIRIVRGSERILLELAAGELRRAQAWDPADYGADLEIAAPPADWDALLAAVPRPFYQDLFAAQAHHGFRLNGADHHLCAYYPAVRRLVELMREVRHDAV